LCLIVAASGCGNGGEPADKAGAKEALGERQSLLVVAPPPATQPLALNSVLPAGVTVSQIGLSASGSVAIRDRAKVTNQAGAPGLIGALSSTQSHFGQDSKVGSVYAAGAVFLAERALIAGDLRVAGAVTKQQGVQVTGSTIVGPVPSQVVTRSIDFPVTLTGNMNVQPDQTVSLAPGALAVLSVSSRSTVKLTAGKYFFDSLSLQPGATLALDQSEGPVSIYVKSNLDLKGAVTSTRAPATDVAWGYFGTNTVFLESAFQGSLIAPAATVVLKRAASPHRGSVYAKVIELEADASFVFVPSTKTLITDVRVDKTSVCANEPVTISVLANSGGANGPLHISVNGNPGAATQTIQLAGRPRRVSIPVQVGVIGGPSSLSTVTVEVKECAGQALLPRVQFGPNPHKPNTVDLVVRNADELGLVNPTFVWNFGDGQSSTTTTRYVAHNYAAALSATTEFSSFDVELKIQQAGKPDLVVRKTVPVVSTYAYNKRRGQLIPPVSNQRQLTQAAGSWSGQLTVQNLEAGPISFDKQYIELQPCDSAVEPTVLPVRAVSVSVPASSSTNVSFSVSDQTLGSNVCGVGVRMTGPNVAGASVTSAGYFTVRSRERAPLTDAVKIAALKQIVDQNLVANPDLVTDEDLYRLSLEGKIDRQISSDTSFFAPQAKSGERCTPGDDPERPGLSCQAASDLNGNPEYDFDRAYVQNALKGDAILSHACGLIGGLLASVNPPRIFSHSGMMVSHYDQIRQSTAAEERYFENADGDGIETNVLKFGWPGTITLSVDEAYKGKSIQDPQFTNKRYVISGFEGTVNSCEGDTLPVSPMILKAKPGSGEAGREPLRLAADVLKSGSLPESNYRFFAYSDQEGVAQTEAPADPAWAEGTNGTMCAGLIWTAFNAAGVELEGSQVEPFDLGAVLRPGAVDGLYVYDPGERYAAAKYLLKTVDDLVNDEYGVLGDIADADDDLGNQIVNCFAFDKCDKTSDEDDDWQDGPDKLGEGLTVAPDDMMFWDVYGHREPQLYQSGGYHRIYRWAASEDTGTLTGDVQLENGDLVPNASLTLAGIDSESDSDGNFSFIGVPQGNYQLDGSVLLNGFLFTGFKNVVVNAGDNDPITLFLTPPEQFRELQITGTVFLRDDEDFGDVTETYNVNSIVHLEPANPTGTWRFNKCLDGELRAEIDMSFTLDTGDYGVDVVTVAKMFEGDSCDTDDDDDDATFDTRIAKDAQEPFKFNLDNSGFGGGDEIKVNINITNAQKTF
jgi:hypothetical protein